MLAAINHVKKKYGSQLMGLPGVVSVGIGKDSSGNLAIIVGLDRARPETQRQLPESLDGYPVFVQVTGPIKAQ